MSHVVRKHLRLESDAYDAAIRTFIPGYEEALTRAASEIAGVRPTLVLDFRVVAQIKCEVERDPDETGGMKSRVHPKYKTKYRVRNWASYERAPIGRGNITIWLSRAAIAAWKPEGTRTRGAPPTYSDLAIETALTLRLLFHLPLRQAEGFLTSLFHLMGLDLRSPDHTTLSRRGQHLNLTLRRAPRRAALHLFIDSTGLSMVGEGEWGRCCTNRHWPARCQSTRSSHADAIRHWSSEGGHPIQDLTAEDDLTPLPGWTPGAKAIADDGLVAEERVLHPALTMVP